VKVVVTTVETAELEVRDMDEPIVYSQPQQLSIEALFSMLAKTCATERRRRQIMYPRLSPSVLKKVV
jgi:hypothetical protein